MKLQVKENLKRKRKELINIDSDNDENDSNINELHKPNKQESKEEENTECTNNTRQSKYVNDKFNTIQDYSCHNFFNI